MRLSESRREHFCQLIVDGNKVPEAYENAGFSPNPGNASKLYHNVEIQARISEIQLERAEGMLAPVDDIMKAMANNNNLDLTKTWVLEQLMLLTQKAKLDGQANAAFRCLELMGEYLGMWGKVGAGKGAEKIGRQSKKEKAVQSQDYSRLAGLTKVFRQMDNEKAERDAHEAIINEGAEGNPQVLEESEGIESGFGMEPDEGEDSSS